MKMYSDLADNVKEIFIMGGNFSGTLRTQLKKISRALTKNCCLSGVGNTLRRCAEFNFCFDPEAAFIVLTKAKCPITILPWEPCTPANLNMTLVCSKGFSY